MKLAVLCPGQGGQTASMFDPFAGDEEARALLARAGTIAGFDPDDAARSAATRFDNAIAQPTICAFQGIAWSSLRARLAAVGIEATLVAGYSVGELAAWHCADSLTFDDTIALASERAAAMDAASGDDDGLLAVGGCSRAAIDAVCLDRGAFVAIVNGAERFIVGGTGPALAGVAVVVVARGGTAERLPVRIAAHTPLLHRAVVPFRDALARRRWIAPRMPVLAGIDGTLVREPTGAIDRLSRQVATTIRWVDCMDTLQERGITVAIELGPGNALSRMLRDRHPTIEARSLSDFRSVAAAVGWIERVAD